MMNTTTIVAMALTIVIMVTIMDTATLLMDTVTDIITAIRMDMVTATTPVIALQALLQKNITVTEKPKSGSRQILLKSRPKKLKMLTRRKRLREQKNLNKLKRKR